MSNRQTRCAGMFLRFIDWPKAAENALCWYERVLTSMALPGEKKDDTEKRINASRRCSAGGKTRGQLSMRLLDDDLTKMIPFFLDAWERLPETERLILREFYIIGGEGTLDTVMRISEMIGYERTKIYEIKRSALSRLAFMLFGHG